MLGQISYRQQDTVGRPGSYFGHVLFSERDGDPWSVLDCLQLWGAGWADEDSPDLPFDLPTLDELGRLRRGLQPIINDALLLSFLKTPPGKPFDDPHGLIPERWKITSEAERTALLTDVLREYLSLGANRRESVLLVIEPRVAALIFYGVARLLPRGALRDEISFSTFEPSADRLPVALAATTFHLPETTDLRPELYRGRGYVNNTFLKKCSERPRADGTYARVVVEKLLATDWPDIDRVLHGFETANARNSRDLEDLAQTLELVPTLLDPAAELPHMQRSPVALSYLGHAVRERLAREPADSRLVSKLVGTRRHLSTLELIATDSKSSEAVEAIQFLLQRLPEDGFADLVASEQIDRRFKVDALFEFIKLHSKFPEPCESLWGGPTSKRSVEKDAAKSPLAKLLTRLPGDTLDKLADSVPEPRKDRFLLALIEACRRSPAKPSALSLLARLVRERDDDQLCEFLCNNAAECAPDRYPEQETALCGRLPDLLKSLPRSGPQFDKHLDLLKEWLGHFPDVAAAERRLGYWGTLRTTLQTLRDDSAIKPSMGLGKSALDHDDAGKKLAETLRLVMPDQEYQDDVTGSKRVACLRRLGEGLLGQSNFLPDVVWGKIQNYLQSPTWTSAKLSPIPVSSPRSNNQSRKESNSLTRSLRPFIVAAAMGVTLPLLLWAYLRSGPSGQVAQGTDLEGKGAIPRRSAPGKSDSGKPDPGKSDSGKSDSGKPDSGKPDSGKPDSGKSDSGKPDSGKPDPGKPDPGKPDPGKPDSGKPDSGKPDPGKPDSGKPDPGKSDSGKPDPGKPDSGKPDSGKPDPGKPDSGKPDSGKPDSGKPDSGKPDPGKPDQGKPDSGKPDPGKPDPGKPDPKALDPTGKIRVQYVGLPEVPSPGKDSEATKVCPDLDIIDYTIHFPEPASFMLPKGSWTAAKEASPEKSPERLLVKVNNRLLASFQLSYTRNGFTFRWARSGNFNEVDVYGARLLRACVLEIRTKEIPLFFVALSKQFKYRALPFNKHGLAEVSIKQPAYAASNTSSTYRPSCGEVLWKNHEYTFQAVLNEAQQFPLVGITEDAPPMNAAIAAKIENGKVTIQLISNDGTDVKQFENARVSARFYRVLDVGSAGKLHIEDVIIGTWPDTSIGVVLEQH